MLVLLRYQRYHDLRFSHYYWARSYAMFDLNDSDMLSKVHQYKLDRPDGWCYISVHEITAGKRARVQFIAVPNLAVQQAEKEFFGVGENVENALADCLAKIKTVPIQNLFPRLEEAYRQSPTG